MPAIMPVGYESPCGVMSIFGQAKINMPAMLRIPMRGYENHWGLPGLRSYLLRIPMRGYEEGLEFNGNAITSRYESPCGVMSMKKLLILNMPVTVTNPHAGL